MLTGFNHLTLAVGDIPRSFTFYRDILGFTPEAIWDQGAYLSLGELWLCLSLDSVDQKRDYTHYAFSISEVLMPAFKARLENAGVKEWKVNSSEGDSIYFLDPDGHRLEAHCGDLKSRLKSCQLLPYRGMQFF